MAFHNPFLKDGLLRFPDNGSVVRHVEKWAKVRGTSLRTDLWTSPPSARALSAT